MARYLIDTDSLIDYSKGRQPAANRIQQMIDQGDELGVCAVNVAEFFAGVPPADRPYWRRVFSTLIYWDISPESALRAGEFRHDFSQQGLTLATTDTLIAAAAMEHDATILTRNVRHYPMDGVDLLPLGDGGAR